MPPPVGYRAHFIINLTDTVFFNPGQSSQDLIQLAVEERVDVAAVVAVLLEDAEAVLDELCDEGLGGLLVEGRCGGRQVELHVLALEITRGEPLMTCSGSFAILLSKLSQRSNLTSNLKSVTSITLISMCMLPF